MKLAWDISGTRVYEAGADRGVLYLSGKPGVPWNGLVSVSESKSGGDPRPYYVDGVKYLNIASAEEYQATITALSAPDEFMACNGSSMVLNGLFADQQHRNPFGFTYRSKMGNDTFGIDYGYKIHLVYNALAAPSSRAYKTLTATPEAMEKSWDITTVPEYLSGFRPTAHFIVDSTKSDPIVLGYLESILYGTTQLDPRLPTPTELKNLFGYVSTRPVPQPINIIGQITTASQKITNLITNPDFETAGATTVVWQNLLTNPDFETAGSAVVVRTNRFPNPQNAGTAVSGRAPNNNAYSLGSPTGSYTMSSGIQYMTVTAMAAGVGTERFGIAVTAYSLGSLLPSGSQISITMDTYIGALPAGVRARLYVDVQDSTNGNATRANYSGYFDSSSGRFGGTVTTNGTADTVRFYVWIENNNASAAFSGTATVGFTNTLVEVGPPTPLGYFDGGNQPSVRENLVLNPVPPSGSTPTSWTSNRPANGTITAPATGEVLYTITTGGTGLTEGIVAQGIRGDGGGYYSARIEVKAEGSLIGRTAGSAQIWNGAMSLGTANNITYTGAWQTIEILSTVPLTSGGGGLSIYCYIPGALTGDILRLRNPIIQKVSGVGVAASPFFYSGSVKQGFTYGLKTVLGSSAHAEFDADLPVRWQGTVGNSLSELYGTAPAGYTGSTSGRFAIIQSVRYTKFGTKSARCIPLPGATGDEYIQFDIPAGTGRTNGGTVLVSRYQEAAITIPGGSFAARALRPVVYTPETIAPGLVNGPGWQDMRMTYPTLTSVYQLRLYHGGLYGSGDVWYDMAALIPGVYNGSYFDGATRPVLRTNMATYSQPTVSAGWSANNGSLYSRSFDSSGGRRPGTGAVKYTRLATGPTAQIASAYAAGIGGWSVAGRIPCVAGQQVVASAYSKAELPFNSYVIISFYNDLNVQVGASITGATINGNANEWIRPFVTATVPAGATSYGIGNQSINLQSGSTVGGEIAWMTDAQYELGSVPTSFFDGVLTSPGFDYSYTGVAGQSTSIERDADLAVRWQGTAGASVSEVTGVGVAGWTASNCVVIQSARGTKQGVKSGRVIANHPTNYSYVEVTGANVAPVGLDTAIAWIYFEQAYTGFTRPRTIGLGYNTGNPNGISASAPNVPGQYELRVQATMVNLGRLLLFSDTKMGDPDVWFDLAAVISGAYSGPAFTGDTPGFNYNNTEMKPLWNGAANASTSFIEYWMEFLNPANQGDAYIIAGNLWVYNAGVWGNYGPVPTT